MLSKSIEQTRSKTKQRCCTVPSHTTGSTEDTGWCKKSVDLIDLLKMNIWIKFYWFILHHSNRLLDINLSFFNLLYSGYILVTLYHTCRIVHIRTYIYAILMYSYTSCTYLGIASKLLPSWVLWDANKTHNRDARTAHTHSRKYRKKTSATKL